MGRTTDAARTLAAAPKGTLVLKSDRLVWDEVSGPTRAESLSGIALVAAALHASGVVAIRTSSTGLVYVDKATGAATLVDEDETARGAISVAQFSAAFEAREREWGARFTECGRGFVCSLERIRTWGATRDEAWLRAWVKSFPMRYEKTEHLLVHRDAQEMFDELEANPAADAAQIERQLQRTEVAKLVLAIRLQSRLALLLHQAENAKWPVPTAQAT